METNIQTLIAALRVCNDGGTTLECADCPYFSDANLCGNLRANAADTIEALVGQCGLANADKIIAERKEKDARALFMEVSNTLQERRWISVHEKLPEESGKYLVCTERGNVYQTKFYSYPESRGGHWGQKDKGRSITHWMRLPEAPKTGGAK